MKKGKEKAKIDWPSILAQAIADLLIGILLLLIDKII